MTQEHPPAIRNATAAPPLVVARPEGLYCPPGDFYIDPWRRVQRAVITHAHADHARTGSAHYLATRSGEAVLRQRLGDITLQALDYGERIVHHGVTLSLHPAGHVLGSAQVRLEWGGQVWVVSGDYKPEPAGDHNPTCAPFEPVRCDCFVTECTFGLPVYRWKPQRQLLDEVDAWWQANADAGLPSLLYGYSLGKAQRLLAGVDARIGPIYVHPAVEPINRAYRDSGVRLPGTLVLPPSGLPKDELRRALVVAPPGAAQGDWQKKLGSDVSDAMASGWMHLRGMRRRYGVDRGFALSDHADWPGLVGAIAATGAQRVIVTHGQEGVLVRWLQEQGLEAGAFETEYGDEGGAAA